VYDVICSGPIIGDKKPLRQKNCRTGAHDGPG